MFTVLYDFFFSMCVCNVYVCTHMCVRVCVHLVSVCTYMCVISLYIYVFVCE